MNSDKIRERNYARTRDEWLIEASIIHGYKPRIHFRHKWNTNINWDTRGMRYCIKCGKIETWNVVWL